MPKYEQDHLDLQQEQVEDYSMIIFCVSEMLSLTSRPHLDQGLEDLSERLGRFLSLMAVRWSSGC